MNRFALRCLMSIVMVVGALTLAAAQNSVPVSAQPALYAGATVSGWTRNVSLELPGKSVSSPSRGERLPAGTLLDTKDGILVLLLEDESQIILRPHTRLQLKQPAVGDWSYFDIILGQVRAFIKKRTGGAPPFELGTPSAVIAVRGTRFDVEVDRHSITEVDVFEGLVEVAAVGIRGSSVLVRPGYSTRVGKGTAPEPPVRTYEIRPGGVASDRSASAEFLRERKLESFGSMAPDMRERSETESLESQSQGAIEGPNDPD